MSELTEEQMEALRDTKASREQLERIAAAARWFVIVTIDGCRTDTAWFEMKAAVADVEPVELP